MRRLVRTVFRFALLTQTARTNRRKIPETDSQTDRLTCKNRSERQRINIQKIKKCDFILGMKNLSQTSSLAENRE